MSTENRPARRRGMLFLITLGSGVVLAVMGALDIDPVAEALVTTLNAAVPGGFAIFDELRAERRTSQTQRAEELSLGLAHGDPWKLVALASLGLVAIERIVMVLFALFYAALVALVAGRAALSLDDVVFTTVRLSLPVAAPGMILASLFLARYIAHRVPTQPILWVFGSLLGALVIDILLVLVFLAGLEDFSYTDLAKVYALVFVPMGVAAFMGVRWAQRGRGGYLVARLYRRLSGPDQAALIEVARGVADSSVR